MICIVLVQSRLSTTLIWLQAIIVAQKVTNIEFYGLVAVQNCVQLAGVSEQPADPVQHPDHFILTDIGYTRNDQGTSALAQETEGIQV